MYVVLHRPSCCCCTLRTTWPISGFLRPPASRAASERQQDDLKFVRGVFTNVIDPALLGTVCGSQLIRSNMWGRALLVLDGDKILRDESIMAAGAQLHSCNGCAHSERPLWDSRNHSGDYRRRKLLRWVHRLVLGDVVLHHATFTFTHELVVRGKVPVKYIKAVVCDRRETADRLGPVPPGMIVTTLSHLGGGRRARLAQLRDLLERRRR